MTTLENDSQLVASSLAYTFRDTHTDHDLVLNVTVTVTVTLTNFLFTCIFRSRFWTALTYGVPQVTSIYCIHTCDGIIGRGTQASWLK